MTLRMRVMLHLNGLLLVTVVLISALTLFTTIHGLRETARRNALGTASLLAGAASMTVQAPQEAERLISDQMIVEARLIAHLVAVAEGKAKLPAAEINAILTDVTANTVLEEVWVAGADGVAHLSIPRPKSGEEEFQFSPDATLQPQAHEFWKLLSDREGKEVVNQKAQPRALDGVWFKYVGVSSVEPEIPRIVQVGCQAERLNRLTAQFGVGHLVENVIDAGHLEAIFVADSQGQLVTANSPMQSKDLESEYYQGLDVLALETIKTLKPSVRFRGNSVEASVPLAGFGSRPGR